MTAYQKKYRQADLMQTYAIYWHALRSIPAMKRYEADGTISTQFVERLMLAVTEVNGCAVCSYAHAKMALEAGLSEKEVEMILAGVSDTVPSVEKPAVLFAQHYAETKGHPAQEAVTRIKELYGEEKADAILCAIQVIMLGNTFGIPIGSLVNRFRRRQNNNGPKTSIGYEIVMLLAVILYLPFCVVTAFMAALIRIPRTAVVTA